MDGPLIPRPGIIKIIMCILFYKYIIEAKIGLPMFEYSCVCGFWAEEVECSARRCALLKLNIVDEVCVISLWGLRV